MDVLMGGIKFHRNVWGFKLLAWQHSDTNDILGTILKRVGRALQQDCLAWRKFGDLQWQQTKWTAKLDFE